MGRLDTSYTPPQREEPKQTQPQTPVAQQEPEPKPIITDYASL